MSPLLGPLLGMSPLPFAQFFVKESKALNRTPFRFLILPRLLQETNHRHETF
jgi:hypothetical protein